MAKRVSIILQLAERVKPVDVAAQLGCHINTVYKWRDTWLEWPHLEALFDAARSGRPPKISVETRCKIVALACSRPDNDIAPFRDVWTHQVLADALFAKSGAKVSRSSVQRVLSAKGLRPHRVRPWLHSPDPEFKSKVSRICALYQNPPEDALIICFDEKPMQILSRRYPTHSSRDASVRRAFEYVRHGTRSLLGAFDVRTGNVTAQIVERRDAAAILRFLEVIARLYPDRRIIVIWDNLNIHKEGTDNRWSRFNARHGGRFEFVYTPIHASWVNQIEIWFSILQRRILRYGSFDDARELEVAVMGFIQFWNRYEARPFRWKFTGNFIQAPRRIDASTRPQEHVKAIRHRNRTGRRREVVSSSRAA
jgi:transposase